MSIMSRTQDNLVTSEALIGVLMGGAIVAMSIGGAALGGFAGAAFGVGLGLSFAGLGLVIEKVAAKIISHLEK